MTEEEFLQVRDKLNNGDLIRVEFNSNKNAKGAMEGRYMHTHDDEGEHWYIHFTDGIQVFYLKTNVADVIKNITVLEPWEIEQ